MRIISWNVNGIRAVMKKNFFEFVKEEKPDVLCVQETKAHPDQVDAMLSEYPHHYWNSAEKKGYSGTAIFSKVKPISVMFGVDEVNHKGEGRIIQVEFETIYLVNVYTPNSGSALKRLDYRKEWDQNFFSYLKTLEETKPVVLCGDLNVAHKDIDLEHPQANYNKSAGYTQTEIDGMNRYLQGGFVDTFREFNKDPKNYTWWSYRTKARDRNVGWRIDYFLVSQALKQKLKEATILSQVLGSDHCPVTLTIDL